MDTGCGWFYHQSDDVLPSSGIGTLPQIERVTMTVNEGSNEMSSDGSTWDAYLQPDNLHGIKLYREPYDRDIVTFSLQQVLVLSVSTVIKLCFSPQISILELRLDTWSPLKEQILSPILTVLTLLVLDLPQRISRGYSDIVNVASGSTTLSVVPVITVQDPQSWTHYT